MAFVPLDIDSDNFPRLKTLRLFNVSNSPIPPQPLLTVFLQLVRRSVSHLLPLGPLNPQRRIRMRVVGPAQTRVPLIIELAVRDLQMPQELRPHLGNISPWPGRIIDAKEERERGKKKKRKKKGRG